MPTKKDEKLGRQLDKAEKPLAQKVSPKRTKPVTKGPSANVSIGGNVTNSRITVLSGIFSWGFLTERIQQYRRQPSLLLFDFSYLGMFSAVSMSIAYLVFVYLYYGSNTAVFSSPGSLLLFSKLDSLVFKLLYTVLIIFLIVSLYRFFKGHITKSTLRFSLLSISFLAIIALAFVLSATKVKLELIKVNYPLARADELVSVSRFDLAKEILLLYPEANRMPSYAVAVAQVRDSQEWSSQAPKEADTETTNEVLDRFTNVISKLYRAGNYQEVIKTVCGIRDADLRKALIPYWRASAYVMAHDPAWGPENTRNWIDQVKNEFPDCQNISSVFWLAIPPEIAWFIQLRDWNYGEGQLGYLYWKWTGVPLDRTIDETLPDMNIRDICKGDPLQDLSKVDNTLYEYYRRCEYDMRLVEDYLVRFPEDQYADYGKLVLGHLDQIIQEGSEVNKNIYDFAFYEKGWRQYREEHYDAALDTFKRFLYLKEFSTHPWRDDALWRAAMCYKHMKDYKNALHYLSLMESEIDGDVPEYADMDVNVLYIADVLMPIDQLDRAVSENTFSNLLPILKYTLAERRLAEGSYADSRRLFLEISNDYRGQVFEPNIGKKYSYSELADQKLKVIDVLMSYQEEHSKDANLLIADYLDTYDAFSPLENDLRYYIPMFLNAEQVTTEDYLVNRSKTYVAAKRREEFIRENPRDPRVPDLLFKVAQGYETVASWQDLPESADFLAMVRKKASDSYIKYLDQYPNHDSKKFDEALEHAGSLYLTRCLYDSGFSCDMDSIKGMRDVYIQLVNKYPEHRLANNMLNWIAWSYCFEANLPSNSNQQYIDAYRLAWATYYRIATQYPDGAIGENARRNMPIIEEKIKNPGERKKFAPANWDW